MRKEKQIREALEAQEEIVKKNRKRLNGDLHPGARDLFTNEKNTAQEKVDILSWVLNEE